MPPPKCDVIIQECLKDAKNGKAQLLIFLRGINQFPHDYQMNIAQSASRIPVSCRGMQVQFMTEIKCCIFIVVCKINHD